VEFRQIDLSLDSEIERVYIVLKELRSTPSLSEAKAIIAAAALTGAYRMVEAFDNEKCVGVMAFRILHDFTHGRHLYIDDLVVTEKMRGKGIGEKFLEYAEAVAQKGGCSNLRLCTGLDNKQAQKFYERCGWQARAYAFKKKLSK
jgi:ribosomal protein S18 acetylase RimI-like enzyme